MNNNFMKTFLTLLSMVVFANMSFLPNDQVTIISSYSYLYEDASFSSNKIQLDGEDLLLMHGQSLEVINEEGDFVRVQVSLNQQSYQGYIYKYYITTNTPQTVYPVFNGSIRTDGAVIYDLNKTPTEYTAQKNQGVYIYSGFDDEEEYTAIQIVLSDGSLYNGYIKTTDLSPDGVSPLLIVGVSLIAAAVTVILSLVFIKKKIIGSRA